MRFCRALILSIALATAPAAMLRAQNVEVTGWKPSEWRLVPSAEESVQAAERTSGSVSVEQSPRQSAEDRARWVRWGINDSTAALATVNGRMSVQTDARDLPAGCALSSAAGTNVRAYSAECVAAAALASNRAAEARAGLRWNGGPVSLLASVGAGSSVAPLTESFNPLGSLPVWLFGGGLGHDALIEGALTGGQLSVRSRDVAIQGEWRVNSVVTMQLLGSQGELSASASPMPASFATAEQTVLGFGISAGSLSGSVTGRRITPLSPLRDAAGLTAIDLGVSWRTPWQGQLTVGARELSISSAAADAAEARDGLEDRTPYVQYRQDL